MFTKKITIPINLQNYIYDTYFDQIFRIALSITRDIQLSEEVCQETFISCFQKYHQLRDPQKTGPWLSSIAVNTARSIIKKRHNVIPMAPDEINVLNTIDNTTPESIYQRHEEQNLLISAISQLPDEFQDVVILKYYHDLDINDITEITGVPEGTVKSRLYRARKKLKQIIESKETASNLKVREG